MPQSGSALDTLRQQLAVQPGQLETPQAPENPSSGADVMGELRSQVTAQPRLAAAETQASKSPFDELHSQLSPQAQQPRDEYERMGEGESWLTRPLTTQLGIPEYRQGAGPIERGVEKFASGLTSPLSLGLMLVTGGLGGLAEAGAAEAGEGIVSSFAGQAGEAVLSRLAPATAAKVASASGVISKLANTGFTLQQIGSVATSVPQIADLIKSGTPEDIAKAEELITSSLLNGAVAGLSARHLARSFPGGKATEPTWTGDKDAITASQQPVRMAGAKAREFEKTNEALIRNKPLDMAARLYHEAGGDTATLEKWREDIADNPSLKPTLQVKYDSLLQLAQNLPDPVKALSAQLRQDYSQDWEEMQSMGKTHPESKGAGNYAGQHSYIPGDEGGSSLRYTGGRKLTKSPGFLKERTFDTIVEAIHNGFEPKEIGLAGARAEYIRGLGNMRGAMAAEGELFKQQGDDARPLGVDPARVRKIDGKKVVRVDPTTDLSEVLEKKPSAVSTQPSATEVEEEPATSTAAKFFDISTKTWAPERQAIHDQAVEQHLAGHQGQEKPTIYILGGGTASGKTTASRSLLENVADIVRIDPDEFKLKVPEYKSLKASDPASAAALVHTESKAITKATLKSALARRLNIVYDTTTSGGGKAEFLQGLKKDGYKVDLRFFDVSLEEAKRRAAERAANSTDPVNRGRIVPEEHIVKSHAGAAKNFFELKDLADASNLYDNNGDKPSIIYERDANGKETIHQPKQLEQYRQKGAVPGSGSDSIQGGRGGVVPDGRGGAAEVKAPHLIVHEGKLYWDVSDYREGPDVFQRYRYRTSDESGDPVFDRANVLLHPDYHEPITQAFADTSWFRKNPVTRALLNVSTQAKKSLLSFSPFHWTTEYLRGIQMGLTPVEALLPEPITPDRLAVRAKFGPKLSLENERGLAEEGLRTNLPLVNKIPYVGPILTAVEEKLFGGDGYIDRLKAASFEKVTSQIAKRHSNWTEDQVHFQSSKIVDAAFGGLNWKMLGTSLNSQDALRLVMLAPDFTGSQLLFAKYGMAPGGSVVHQSLARIALYNFAVFRVLNMITSGKLHMEHPFGVVSSDDKHVFSIRTMPQDIAHALSDPRGFTRNRLNPVLARSGWEALSGKDDKGHAVTTQKQIVDLIRNVIPISGQNFVPAFRRPEEGWGISVARGLGLAVEPERSSADRMAGQLASNRSSSGPVEPEKLARHQAVLQFEDALRSGKAKAQDLYQAYESGVISKKDAREIHKNVMETREMDPGTARLYTRMTRLPMKDFLDVWQVTTTPEKVALEKLFMKRRREYFKNAAQNMSLAERLRDPVYKRLRELQPQEAPW